MSHETFQCTEEDHCDREDLLNAVNIMSNIAAFINESKRRKDIGKFDKYENYCNVVKLNYISFLNSYYRI